MIFSQKCITFYISKHKYFFNALNTPSTTPDTDCPQYVVVFIVIIIKWMESSGGESLAFPLS